MTQIQTINPGATGNRTLRSSHFATDWWPISRSSSHSFTPSASSRLRRCRRASTGPDWRRSGRRQPAANVAVRRATQRDGAPAVQAVVDAVRAGGDRAQHLCATCSLCLLLLFWQWRQCRRLFGKSTTPMSPLTVATVSLGGWVIVLTSTFMINHFELFGLHQVANHLTRPRNAGSATSGRRCIKAGAAPDLSRLHHRVLGGPDHDGRTSAVCSRHHGLYPGRAFSSKSATWSTLFGDEQPPGYRKQVAMLLPGASRSDQGLISARNI